MYRLLSLTYLLLFFWPRHNGASYGFAWGQFVHADHGRSFHPTVPRWLPEEQGPSSHSIFLMKVIRGVALLATRSMRIAGNAPASAASGDPSSPA